MIGVSQGKRDTLVFNVYQTIPPQAPCRSCSGALDCIAWSSSAHGCWLSCQGIIDALDQISIFFWAFEGLLVHVSSKAETELLTGQVKIMYKIKSSRAARRWTLWWGCLSTIVSKIRHERSLSTFLCLFTWIAKKKDSLASWYLTM